mgnify:FL=1
MSPVRGDAGAQIVDNAALNGAAVKALRQHNLVTDEKLIVSLTKFGSFGRG